nr:hypothetical protein [uncultured Carboxylicivirga sp.]
MRRLLRTVDELMASGTTSRFSKPPFRYVRTLSLPTAHLASYCLPSD